MDKRKNYSIRTGGSLSWSEREAMIQDYLSGRYSKIEVWKKYTGQSEEHGQMLRWMRKLGYIADTNNLIAQRTKETQSSNFLSLSINNNKSQDPEELQSRIKELEKQLELAKIKAEGLDLMIDIAEKELKIPIRKKSNTK